MNEHEATRFRAKNASLHKCVDGCGGSAIRFVNADGTPNVNTGASAYPEGVADARL
jgi:hypothetical protein